MASRHAPALNNLHQPGQAAAPIAAAEQQHLCVCHPRCPPTSQLPHPEDMASPAAAGAAAAAAAAARSGLAGEGKGLVGEGSDAPPLM